MARSMTSALTKKGIAFHHETLDKVRKLLQALLNEQMSLSEETEAIEGDNWCYTNLFLHMWVGKRDLDGTPCHEQFWITLDCFSDTTMKFTLSLGGNILDEFSWEKKQGDGVIALWVNHVCNQISEFPWTPYV